MGASRGSASGPASGCAKIYAEGVLLTEGAFHPPASVAAYDLDGALGGSTAGVGPSDLSVWLNDAFSIYRARSDFDYGASGCAGALTPADLARWLTIYFAAGSTSNFSAIGCP